MKQGLFVAAALLVSGALVSGQTLGDIARREEERRKGVKAPGKSYTNENLRPEAPPATLPPRAGSSTPVAEPPPAAVTQPAPVVEPPPVEAPTAGATPEAPRDQKYWSGRIAGARAALQRSQTVQDALQSRINALALDFVNRDDPAQQRQIAAERDKALAELARVKDEIVQQTKAITDIQEEARRAGAPAGWVR